MKKNGFTLLEMIVVVMIVAALFVLTIPNITKVIDLVDTKACNALTKVIDTAIVEYKMEFDEPPGSLQDLFNAGFITEEQMKCGNGDAIVIVDGHAQY